MLTRYTLAHLVILGLLSGAAAYFDSSKSAMVTALGGGVSLTGTLILIVALRNFLEKKHVALSVSLIVIKYAILGAIIYAVSLRSDLPTGWFAAGLSVAVLTLAISAKALEKAFLSESTGGSGGSAL